MIHRERTYRVLDPDGRVITDVVAETIDAAAEAAERMGYDVLDVSEPDAVVAREAI